MNIALNQCVYIWVICLSISDPIPDIMHREYSETFVSSGKERKFDSFFGINNEM